MRARPLVSGLALLGIAVYVTGCGGASAPTMQVPEPAPFRHMEAPPLVRIGVSLNVSSAVVWSEEAFTLFDATGVRAEGQPGEHFTIRREADKLVLYAPSGAPIGNVGGSLRCVPDDRAGWMYLGETGFPERLDIVRSGTEGLNVVNVVDVETYLRGVVPGEIMHEDRGYLEAVKAQAIAARTYTAGHLNQYPAEGYDLVATVMDQVYHPNKRHPNTDYGVAATRGLILTYDGQPIRANYASTCGGTTASVVESFDGDPLPYLVTKEDRLGDHISCRTSTVYQWKVEWTEAQLLATLRETVPAVLGKRWRGDRILDIDDAERGPSGRILVLNITTDRATYVVRKGAIRQVLLRPTGSWLRSTQVHFDLTRAGDGRVTGVVARGRGWGHGVGMCQWGAMQVSQEGFAFERILAHYYPGARLDLWYETTPATE